MFSVRPSASIMSRSLPSHLGWLSCWKKTFHQRPTTFLTIPFTIAKASPGFNSHIFTHIFKRSSHRHNIVTRFWMFLTISSTHVRDISRYLHHIFIRCSPIFIVSSSWPYQIFTIFSPDVYHIFTRFSSGFHMFSLYRQILIISSSYPHLTLRHHIVLVPAP